MKKAIIVLLILVVIFILLNGCNNSQDEDYGVFPIQDIINIYNKDIWPENEVGDFDFNNDFLNRSQTQSLFENSVLKGYENGNYTLRISDFNDEKENAFINSEFAFYGDTGKVWFFAEGQNLDDQYYFLASIVKNEKIRSPINIKIYDDNYIFGYIRGVYTKSLPQETKYYYFPLIEESFGYSVNFDSKIDGYRLKHFETYIVFKEATSSAELTIETSKSEFNYEIDFSQAMELEKY